MKHPTATFALLTVSTIAFCAAVPASRGDTAPKLSALARMPVKSVTIFKDGNAFVQHEGDMPTSGGDVQMDYLPTPVLGTFWPYSADARARLVSVTAANRRVEVDQTALSLREMIEANTGANVLVDENGNSYSATIVGFPSRSSDELAQTLPPGTSEQLPQKSDIVMLRTNEGVKAVPFNNIQEITFKSDQNTLAPSEQFRNLLTLHLGWQDRHSSPTAHVGLLYLQQGLKWTPSYRITVGDSGTAHIELRATVVNDLTDLSDVAANLVIGVPTFKFAGITDPMALAQAALMQTPEGAATLSNALQSQVSNGAEYRFALKDDFGAGPSVPQPQVTGSEKAEDLFVFSVAHLTLRRGERIQIPVAEYDIPYKDIYKLTVPIAPPRDIALNYSYDQQRQLETQLNKPHVIHALRLTDDSKFPLTTAPALIVKDGSVLGQGMMTYTSTGDKCDLEITQAVDVPVTLKQHEVKRTPNQQIGDTFNYVRVDLAGAVCLTNFRDQPVDLEVDRSVLGILDSADNGGTTEQASVNDITAAFGDELPMWWSWYGWPNWWNQANGVGRATWKVSLPAKKTIELGYNWHYFWR